MSDYVFDRRLELSNAEPGSITRGRIEEACIEACKLYTTLDPKNRIDCEIIDDQIRIFSNSTQYASSVYFLISKIDQEFDDEGRSPAYRNMVADFHKLRKAADESAVSGQSAKPTATKTFSESVGFPSFPNFSARQDKAYDRLKCFLREHGVATEELRTQNSKVRIISADQWAFESGKLMVEWASAQIKSGDITDPQINRQYAQITDTLNKSKSSEQRLAKG